MLGAIALGAFGQLFSGLTDPNSAVSRWQVGKFNVFIFDLVVRKLAALKAHKAPGLAELLDMDMMGHDTANNSLSAAIYLLARHPESHDCPRAEVLTTLDFSTLCPADDFPYVTNDQVASRLPYLTAIIINETLRLYPSIPVI
ncbi:hypothetical protein GGF31_000097 [Allomyces arbusculus]|nr:hypothetical protein GGF31_000097 [Allomyces arbusculus]